MYSGLQISNSDFWVLAGILGAISGLGIWEGYEVHAVFYSQPAIILGFAGYFGYKILYEDTKEKPKSFISSEGSRHRSD